MATYTITSQRTRRNDNTQFSVHPTHCAVVDPTQTVVAAITARGWERADRDMWQGPASDAEWVAHYATELDAPTVTARKSDAEARRTGHGVSFVARHDNDEVCIECGREIVRGQQVRYYYGGNGRTLVHADCTVAHENDEIAGQVTQIGEVY